MRKILLGLFVLGLSSHFACEPNHYQGNKPKMTTEQDSMIDAQSQVFVQKHARQIEQVDHKVAQVLSILTQEERFVPQFTELIPVALAHCSFGKCHWKEGALAMAAPLDMLRDQSNPWSFIPYSMKAAFTNVQAMARGTYETRRYKFSSFRNVQEYQQEDLHNAPLTWQANWLMVLEISNYQKPSEVGRGSLEGYWHFFRFDEVEYLGSAPITSENTRGYQAPNYKEKEITTTRNETKIRPDGRVYLESKTHTETRRESVDPSAAYEKDIKDNFKKECERVLNEYFILSDGRKLYF